MANPSPGHADDLDDWVDFITLRPAYRGHYETHFASSGYQYQHFEPAYQYGTQLAAYRGYAGWVWDQVEPEARQAWEARNPGTWDQIRAAVRYGWDNVRQKVRGESRPGDTPGQR